MLLFQNLVCQKKFIRLYGNELTLPIIVWPNFDFLKNINTSVQKVDVGTLLRGVRRANSYQNHEKQPLKKEIERA